MHRPRYGDWSLPKGKSEPGESDESTALREVEEETGVTARIVRPLPEVRYQVGGRPKVVRYFAMRPVRSATFVPTDEVDEIRWLPIEQAVEAATYDHDRRLLAATLPHLATTGTIWLVRHAAAGDRSAWNGDDRARPLTPKGLRQADAIARSLAPHGIDHIYSSPYVRCRQTVEPLGRQLGLPVGDTQHLTEGARGRDTLEWLLAHAGDNVVACSHGDVIPEMLRRLDGMGVPLRSPNGVYDVKKGSTWTLDVVDGYVRAATYSPPPRA